MTTIFPSADGPTGWLRLHDTYQLPSSGPHKVEREGFLNWAKALEGSRIDDMINPMHRGAVGDGEADDTDVLMDSIATGNSLYIPRGREFKFTTRLEGFVEGQGIFLEGTLHYTGVQQAIRNGAHKFFLVSQTGKGRLYGDRPNIYLASHHGLFVARQDGGVCDGVRVFGVEIDGFGDAGVWAVRVSRFRTHLNYVHNCGTRGIIVLAPRWGCDNSGNSIDEIGPGDAPTQSYGIAITRSTGPFNDDSYPERPRVTNNIVRRVWNGNGIDSHGTDGMLIKGNDIDECLLGIHLEDNDHLGNTQRPQVNAVSGTFQLGETVSAGAISATLRNVQTVTGTDKFLYLILPSAAFPPGVTVTGGTSGATAFIKRGNVGLSGFSGAAGGTMTGGTSGATGTTLTSLRVNITGITGTFSPGNTITTSGGGSGRLFSLISGQMIIHGNTETNVTLTGSWAASQTISNGSGASATIASFATPLLATGVIGVDLDAVSGPFTLGETVTFEAGGTATIAFLGRIVTGTINGGPTKKPDIVANHIRSTAVSEGPGTGAALYGKRIGACINVGGMSNDFLDKQDGVVIANNVLEGGGFDVNSPLGGAHIDSYNPAFDTAQEGNTGLLRLEHCDATITGNTLGTKDRPGRRFNVYVGDGAVVTMGLNRHVAPIAVIGNKSDYDSLRVCIWAGRHNNAPPEANPFANVTGELFLGESGTHGLGQRSAITWGDNGIKHVGCRARDGLTLKFGSNVPDASV